SFINLPVPSVEHVAERRFYEKAIALGDRMGKGHEAHSERPEFNSATSLDNVELHLASKPLLLELAGNQPSSERCRKEGAFQLLGKIGERTDMVFVAMGEYDPCQSFLLTFDEVQIGKNHLDARITGIRES